MKQILVDVPAEPAGLKRLEAMPGAAVRVIEAREEVRPLPIDLVRDVNILFCTYPPANLADMRALEWVQISSVGYSQLYGLGLAERGIRATNARGVFDPTIAEWNLAMMVNL